MKDFTREELESGRPARTPSEVIEFGALLCAKDVVEEFEKLE
jgi:hypothetical protein